MRPRFRVEINKTKRLEILEQSKHNCRLHRFPVITLSESPKGFDDKVIIFFRIHLIELN